jgi:serine/threonine-protein phosphatase 2B catalytic subunit
MRRNLADSQPDDASPASPGSSAANTPDEHPVFDNENPFGAPSSGGAGSPGSPSTPTGGGPGASWRRGHSRQTSLGTTKTSPSNRRRSLENTMHLIRDVVDGRDAGADGNIERLAEVISSPARTKPADG